MFNRICFACQITDRLIALIKKSRFKRIHTAGEIISI